MKLYVLTENTSCSPDFGCEHGLSLYIEANARRLLFDAGQSGLFAQNAEKLGVDLSRVDTAVLSHGHYDHGDGLGRFFELNHTAPVYASVHAFEPHFNSERYNGLDPALLSSGRFRLVSGNVDLSDGLSLISGAGCPSSYPARAEGMFTLCDGARVPDSFSHEQYLLINENGRRILISGCSHRGILNIVSWQRPDLLIGGFHFMNTPLDGEGEKTLTQSAALLPRFAGICCTGHCTGQAQYDFLKARMGERLMRISSGMALEL